jgi:hypothetical protein
MDSAPDVCKPNISGAGRRRRKNVALMAAIVSVVGLGLMLAMGANATTRAMIGFPVFMTALCVLQVKRNTCVKHAASGMFENSDFSTTPSQETDAKNSRRVALTIWRDSALVALLVVALAVGSPSFF